MSYPPPQPNPPFAYNQAPYQQPYQGVPFLPPGSPRGQGPVLASIGQRIGGRLLDLLFSYLLATGVVMAFVLLATVVDNDGQLDTPAASVLIIVGGVLGIATFVLYEVLLTAQGATWGKRIVGARVVRVSDGRTPPGFGLSLGRWAIYYFVGCGWPFNLSSAWLLWDRPLYQALHDKAVKTVVITTK